MASTVRQRGETFAGYTDLTTMCCPTCGVLYALPRRLIDEAHSRGNRELVWYCPNGHELGYNDPPGESEADRLRRELERARNRAASKSAALDQTKAELRGQKARASRFKNDRDRERTRAANGVCPCCNRTFKQLARHMKSQHPEFPVPEPSDG